MSSLISYISRLKGIRWFHESRIYKRQAGQVKKKLGLTYYWDSIYENEQRSMS